MVRVDPVKSSNGGIIRLKLSEFTRAEGNKGKKVPNPVRGVGGFTAVVVAGEGVANKIVPIRVGFNMLEVASDKDKGIIRIFEVSRELREGLSSRELREGLSPLDGSRGAVVDHNYLERARVP